MKSLRNSLKNFSVFQLAIVAIASVFLFLSTALPVAAASNPEKGLTQLETIEKKSENVLKSNPRSFEEMKSDASRGINRVQGAADRDKMSRPENSQDATSVEEEVKGFLRDVTGSK